MKNVLQCYTLRNSENVIAPPPSSSKKKRKKIRSKDTKTP